MSLLRRLLFITLGSLFRLSLFVGVSLLAIVILLGKPTHIEQALVATGAYQEFVPAVTQSISSSEQSTNPIPFSDKGVQKIINDAFSPQLLQTSAQTIINSSYAWLQGDTTQPDFRIDFTRQRQLLADNLTAYAFNRLAAQPLCTVQPTTVNPFTDTCLPRYFNLAAQRQNFSNELDGLLPQTVFTAANLPKLSNGKTIVEGFPQIPAAYRFALLSPWIFGGLLLILSTMMVGFATTTRRGIRLVGSATLSAGITLIITPLLYELVYPTIERALSIQSHNTGLNNISSLLIQNLSRSFYNIIISASLIVMGIGISIMLAERFTRSEGYSDLARKSGMETSGMPESSGGSDTALTADNVPLQTSERSTPPPLSKKKIKKYRTLKKMKDKE